MKLSASIACLLLLGSTTDFATAQFCPLEIVNDQASNTRSICATDIDGNGTVDILGLASTGDRIASYRNSGAGSAWTEFPVFGAMSYLSGIAAADLDGDGDKDVVAVEGAGLARFYENLGAGTLIARGLLNGTSFYGLVLMDVDLDGDPDIVTTQTTSVLWFENLGGLAFGFPGHTIHAGSWATSLEAADLNADGAPDLLAVFSLEGAVGWFERLGPASFGARQDIMNGDVYSYSVVRSADLDLDNDNDVVVTGNNAVYGVGNLGSGVFTPQLTLSSDSHAYSSLALADLDADGDTDLIFGAANPTGHIGWCENIAGSFGPEQRLLDGGWRPESLVVADIDGDGDLDPVGSPVAQNTIGWYPNALNEMAAPSIDIASYWPIDAGYSWKGVAANCPDPCSCSSLGLWDVLAPSPLGPNAYRVGQDVNNCWVLENDGSTFTLHGWYDNGSFQTPPGGAVELGQLVDGASFLAEPTIRVVIRDWSAVTHPDKALYGIDPNLTDVLAWVWYDSNYTGGNIHNDVLESGLPACQQLPSDRGNVTDVEWYVRGEGKHAYMDVDAGSGAPWPPVLDVRYLVSLDCNSNGIIDRLDISSGTSLDLNLDCIPDECTSTGINYCSAWPNSTGSTASISMSGSPLIADNDFSLRTEPLPNQPFLFFYGPNQLQLPFGDGFRCVGGLLVRIGPPGVASSGVALRMLDLTALPIVPGTTNFQCWYRDPAAAQSGFNLSDGLSVTFLP